MIPSTGRPQPALQLLPAAAPALWEARSEPVPEGPECDEEGEEEEEVHVLDRPSQQSPGPLERARSRRRGRSGTTCGPGAISPEFPCCPPLQHGENPDLVPRGGGLPGPPPPPTVSRQVLRVARDLQGDAVQPDLNRLPVERLPDGRDFRFRAEVEAKASWRRHGVRCRQPAPVPAASGCIAGSLPQVDPGRLLHVCHRLAVDPEGVIPWRSAHLHVRHIGDRGSHPNPASSGPAGSGQLVRSDSWQGPRTATPRGAPLETQYGGLRVLLQQRRHPRLPHVWVSIRAQQELVFLQRHHAHAQLPGVQCRRRLSELTDERRRIRMQADGAEEGIRREGRAAEVAPQELDLQLRSAWREGPLHAHPFRRRRGEHAPVRGAGAHELHAGVRENPEYLRQRLRREVQRVGRRRRDLEHRRRARQDARWSADQVGR
eukprot:9476172-Pyramimonas_sp.AAC.2